MKGNQWEAIFVVKRLHQLFELPETCNSLFDFGDRIYCLENRILKIHKKECKFFISILYSNLNFLNYYSDNRSNSRWFSLLLSDFRGTYSQYNRCTKYVLSTVNKHYIIALFKTSKENQFNAKDSNLCISIKKSFWNIREVTKTM